MTELYISSSYFSARGEQHIHIVIPDYAIIDGDYKSNKNDLQMIERGYSQFKY